MKQDNRRIVFEPNDCPLINTKAEARANAKGYIVKLWCGSGYLVDGYLVWANSEHEALYFVVKWLKTNYPNTALLATQEVKKYYQELTQDDAITDEEAQFLITQSYLKIDEDFCYDFDCDIHEYVRNENLMVIQVPEDKLYWFDAPAGK